MKKALAMFAVLLAAGCTQIDTGNVGVESTFGQVKEEEAGPGMYFTMFKTVTEVSTKEFAAQLPDLRPKTKDNLTMADFDVDVYYKVDPAKVADIAVRYAGDMSKTEEGDVLVGYNFVFRNAREAAYATAAEFEAKDMNVKRAEIAESVRNKLQSELDRTAGKGWFTVTNVNVRNIVTDPNIEAAIRNAAQTQFEVSRKQQELALAKAEAERKVVEAQGEADANEIIARSITPNLIRLREIEATAKFARDGTHTVLLGGSATPLVNVK